MNRLVLVIVFLLAVLPASAQQAPLTLVTYDSFSISEDVLASFTEQTGIEVEIVRLADAGAMVNQAILTKNNPLGDVLYGIDSTFLSRGLNAGIFEPYESPALEAIPEAFVLDPDHNVTPVAYGDVCLNYDTAYFSEDGPQLPDSLAELAGPEFAGLLVVENPASSSPGLAFLLATIATFGEEPDTYNWLAFWADLAAYDVLVVDGWTEAYYGEFSGASDGDRPLVVSYASSPPAEVYFADPAPETAPTGVVVLDEACFRQIEFAGILTGTDQRAEAEALIDFMLGVEFQEDLPLQMFVFPVNPDAELPDVFAEYAVIPEHPATIAPEVIEEKREEWIQRWTETVLR